MDIKRYLLAAATVCALIHGCCGQRNAEQMLPRAIDESLAPEFDNVFDEVRTYSTSSVHTLMVVKDGKVIYERYEPGHEPEVLHVMWSASKTFTATAVGFAVQDGLMSVEDKVLQYFTDEEIPEERTPWLEQLTVKNLLTMSAGFRPIHYGLPEFGRDYNWAATQLEQPMYFEPGTRFHYDSFDSYLVSVIVSRVTGKRLDDYLAEKLFKPLGITGYIWEHSPDNYSSGGWGLYLKPESLAKMGQFMLQKGEWNGVQLLNPEWIEEATRPHILQYAGTDPTPEQLEKYKTDDMKSGYGYQIWCLPGGGYRIDGAYGQYCFVYPDKNLVVACFAQSDNTRLLRNSVMENIVSKF